MVIADRFHLHGNMMLRQVKDGPGFGNAAGTREQKAAERIVPGLSGKRKMKFPFQTGKPDGTIRTPDILRDLLQFVTA